MDRRAVGRTHDLAVAEQGAGDALQFIRYAPLVKQQGANVIAACPPSLARLLASCPGVDSVFTSGQPAPRFDVHAWLASLPGIFGTSLDTIPAQVPYLTPSAESCERWHRELADRRRSKSGSPGTAVRPTS